MCRSPGFELASALATCTSGQFQCKVPEQGRGELITRAQGEIRRGCSSSVFIVSFGLHQTHIPNPKTWGWFLRPDAVVDPSWLPALVVKRVWTPVWPENHYACLAGKQKCRFCYLEKWTSQGPCRDFARTSTVAFYTLWKATRTFHESPQHIREQSVLYIGVCVWRAKWFLGVHCEQPRVSIWVYILLSVNPTISDQGPFPSTSLLGHQMAQILKRAVKKKKLYWNRSSRPQTVSQDQTNPKNRTAFALQLFEKGHSENLWCQDLPDGQLDAQRQSTSVMRRIRNAYGPAATVQLPPYKSP